MSTWQNAENRRSGWTSGQNVGIIKSRNIKDATVNFMTLKMSVEFEEGTDAKAVMQDVLKNCKKVEDDCEIYI